MLYHLARALQILLKLLRQLLVEQRAIDDSTDLVVQAKAAVVEVGRADHAQHVVHHHGFGVQHAALVLKDAHASCQQLIEVRARRCADQARVAALWHQHAHIHPPQCGIGQGQHGRFGGHEVGRGQPQALVGSVDGCNLHAVDGFQRVVRA